MGIDVRRYGEREVEVIRLADVDFVLSGSERMYYIAPLMNGDRSSNDWGKFSFAHFLLLHQRSLKFDLIQLYHEFHNCKPLWSNSRLICITRSENE